MFSIRITIKFITILIYPRILIEARHKSLIQGFYHALASSRQYSPITDNCLVMEKTLKNTKGTQLNSNRESSLNYATPMHSLRLIDFGCTPAVTVTLLCANHRQARNILKGHQLKLQFVPTVINNITR